MPASTRNSSAMLAGRSTSRSPSEEVIQKINSSKITSETKEIFKLFLSLFSNLQLERDSTISTLQEKISAMEIESVEMSRKFEKMETLSLGIKMSNTGLAEKVNQLESKLSVIECNHSKEVAALKSNIDLNEQYGRRDTLIISGPNLPIASPNENCKLVVQDLLRRHTKLNLNPSDISIAHRIGRTNASLPDKRNIIFKLCRRDLVTDILNACKQSFSPPSSGLSNQERRPPPIFVNCSLTPTRNKILYALRLLRRKFPSTVKGCRAQIGGDVVVFVVPTPLPSTSSNQNAARNHDRKIIINTKQDLEAFTTNVLSTSLDDLEMRW